MAARLLLWGRMPRQLFAPLNKAGALAEYESALRMDFRRLGEIGDRWARQCDDAPQQYLMVRACGEGVGDGTLPATRDEWKDYFVSPAYKEPVSYTAIPWKLEAAKRYAALSAWDPARGALSMRTWGSIHDSIFEAVAGKALAKGGTFDIRELGGARVGRARVTPAAGGLHRWWDARELATCLAKEDAHHGQFIKSNPDQVAVDLLCRVESDLPGLDGGLVPVKFTAAYHSDVAHDIKVRCVEEVAGALGWCADPRADHR